MNSCYSSEVDNFGFAFNDSNFSDRVLCIQIVSEPPQVTTGGQSCASLPVGARNRKLRRDYYITSKNSVDIAAVDAEEQIINQPHHIPPDDERQETKLGANDIDTSFNLDSLSSCVRVKTLHVSSPILAAKSPFFYKLFSNGMKESEQRQVNLRINASEEAALMELLNFIYSNTLTSTTVPALLDVLMAADRFEVASCMRHCSNLLRDQHMTPESALQYLNLPSSVLMAETVQPLIDAAKEFLAVSYKDLTKFENEVINFPLVGMEAILSSDDLQVASEDAVYDFVLKWARIHYPKIEDRREILTTRLAGIIRFRYMSCRKLREVVTCNDFDAQKVLLETFLSIAESSHKNPNYPPRAYVYKYVKVVRFELPRQQCIVYMDLKREECASLFPSGGISSLGFHVGGQKFFLSGLCNTMNQQSSLKCFGLYLGWVNKGVWFTVDYEFAARSKPHEEYITKCKGTYKFTGAPGLMSKNLFGIPWTTFIGEESVYFINDVLHLRVQLTIRQSN